MILKQKSRSFSFTPIFWSIPFLILAIILLMSRNRIAVSHSKSAESAVLFSCDLEANDGTLFTCADLELEGAAFVTSSVSRSGEKSIALNSTNVYGLTTVFTPDDYKATYHLSVWRYNPNKVDSWLVVAASDPKDLYLSVKEPVQSSDDGWEQLHLVFQVSESFQSVKLYCYAGGDGDNVYFDDIMLEQINLEEIREKYALPRIDLEISDASMRKLQQKRDDAWKRGLLVSNDDDWVEAKIHADDRDLEGKIRLKGDWLDHLKGNKWSFRVDLKNAFSLWGMTTFNLQRPETRGFLNEWLYHKLLHEQDILSPRYKFVLVSLNNDVLGFYACEEHFMKELVESRSRREGPILRFSEDRFWDGIARQFDSLGISNFVFPDDKRIGFETASIRPFKEKKYLDDAPLTDHYHRGAYLMYLYKNQLVKPSQIFDIERLGKFLALVDITGAYHNLTWHNQRWYYNPLSDRLEPIGYDGFTGKQPELHAGSMLIADDVYYGRADSYEPFQQFFYDEAIMEVYVSTLDSLTAPMRTKQVFDRYKDEMQAYENAFSEEYFYFKFDTSWFKNHNKGIHLSLPAYEKTSLIASLSGGELSLRNIHNLPLLVQIPESNGSVRKELLYPDFNNTQIEHLSLDWPIKQLQFTVLGLKNEHHASIDPLGSSKYLDQSITIEANYKDHPSCVILDKEIFIRGGTIQKTLRIPPGFNVRITEGTSINLVDEAYILSESPVYITGTRESPVQISSSDHTGAFLVRNTIAESSVSNCLFVNLARINDRGFSLTGGTTFYEADVQIRDCLFKNSHEEDALNIVRSEFLLEGVVFDSTAFDAFDADFCNGLIDGATFRNTGNDAIDFSGSTVTIKNAYMSDIGDKGISVGEDSDVHLYSAWIDGAVIGVASKDLSTLQIDFISLRNVGTGFTVFQKKATYGPAEILVSKYESEGVDRPFLVEEGSSLTFITENSL